MRIGYDATPAATQRAGVGRYARELLRELVRVDHRDEFRLLSSASASRNADLVATLPPGAIRDVRRLPLGPRLTTAFWHRAGAPLPVEALLGDVELFHGPDFVVPPSRRPRVVTIHDLSYVLAPEHAEPSLARFLRAAVPRSLARAAAIIAVSATVAAELAEHYPGVRERVVAIPNGVAQASCCPPEPFAGPPVVLAVGTIEPRKNLLATIKAMEIVRIRHPDATLQVAGRVGWRADETLAALRAAEASGFARFHPSPDDDALERLYRRATVVAFPSFYEGFGLPVLEAMARRVPVVASDIPALRETADDAARYADPLNIDALASAICEFLDSGTLRREYAERGAARAATFSWRETAERTRRVYSSVARG